jgi:predicted metalloprotease with PDZ domain
MHTRNSLYTLLAMFLLALTVACNHRQADYRLHYTICPDTAGHYLNVCLTYETDSTLPHPTDVVLTMPRWAPGYYEMLDFAKHLTDFCARDIQGEELAWTKEGLNRWRVALPKDGRMEVSYRIYANRRDVASSRVERDIAFVAPNGVFMYVAGEQTHPVSVRFQLPDGWQHIATGMRPDADDSCSFTAPDFDVLYDSPLLLGNFYIKRFAHEGHDYEFALETPDGAEEMEFEENFKRIVSAATKMMGDVPYDNYCLIHMGQGGGGLEHLNSQACYTDGTYRFATRREEVKFLAFVAHEYFHLYNVKCIRPAELWPLDYDHEAITPMLWVSEGLTCYYEFRLLRNAGIATPDEALQLISTYFSLYAPYEGQHHQSLRQSSYDIWLNFMNSDDNTRDVRINYYFKGPVIGLLMDIDIRRKTQQQKSLDDVMRLLYQRYYHELQRGFTEEEFWSACAEVAGEPLTEVRHLVDTTDDIPYDDYLTDAGLRIDTTSWAILPVENPTPAQQQFLRAMSLEE